MTSPEERARLEALERIARPAATWPPPSSPSVDIPLSFLISGLLAAFGCWGLTWGILSEDGTPLQGRVGIALGGLLSLIIGLILATITWRRGGESLSYDPAGVTVKNWRDIGWQQDWSAVQALSFRVEKAKARELHFALQLRAHDREIRRVVPFDKVRDWEPLIAGILHHALTRGVRRPALDLCFRRPFSDTDFGPELRAFETSEPR